MTPASTRFDLPGAVLVTSGLSSLVYAITQAGQKGWLAAETLGVFGASLVLLGAFVAWELRHPEPLDALRDPPDPHRERGERRRVHPGHRAVLDVPDADALHAAGPGLLRDEDGRCLPRGRRYGDRVVGRRRPAGDPGRREAGAGDRDGDADRGPAVLHPGLGRRQLRPRPAARLPDHRGRDRVLLRADLDRGAGGSERRPRPGWHRA